MVGTGLAFLGSVYLAIAKASMSEADSQDLQANRSRPPSSHTLQTSIEMARLSTDGARQPSNNDANGRERNATVQERLTPPDPNESILKDSYPPIPDAGRRKVAKIMRRISNFLVPDQPRPNRDAFKTGPAADWPTIPAEQNRNENLAGIQQEYNHRVPTLPSTPTGDERSSPSSTSEIRPSLGIGGLQGIHGPRSRSQPPPHRTEVLGIRDPEEFNTARGRRGGNWGGLVAGAGSAEDGTSLCHGTVQGIDPATVQLDSSRASTEFTTEVVKATPASPSILLSSPPDQTPPYG